MLSFPAAFGSSGFALGTFLLVSFAVASVASQVMLSRLARRFGRPSSFRKTCAMSGLPALGTAIDAAVVLVCSGAGIAYLMIAGDTLARVLGNGRPKVRAHDRMHGMTTAALRSFTLR